MLEHGSTAVGHFRITIPSIGLRILFFGGKELLPKNPIWGPVWPKNRVIMQKMSK